MSGLVTRASRLGAVDGLSRLAARLDRRRPDLLAALTWHRVVPAGEPVTPGIGGVTPEAFAAQAEMLAAEYRVVSLGDVLARRRGGAALPPRAVLLTFDDAYADFADYAWPVLRRLGLPAALFVPTGHVGRSGSFWWDRLYGSIRGAAATDGWTSPVGPLPLRSPAERDAAYRALRTHLKSLGHAEAMALVDAVVAELATGELGTGEPAMPAVLDWGTLRRLAGEGVELAPHGRSHALLTRLGPTDLDAEVAGSWADLRAEVEGAVAALAYPSGAVSSDVEAAAARAGIEVAFTTRRGLNDLRAPGWLRLRRINVGGRTERSAVRLQVHSLAGPLVARILERGAGGSRRGALVRRSARQDRSVPAR